MFKVAVVDGQGGGIGSLIVRRLREVFGDRIEIYALGTNSAATTAMMKARANKGATGENAILVNVSKMDVIIGPLSIVLSNSMLGELTAKMAEAIATTEAKKILLPINQEGIEIVGVEGEPLPHLVDRVIERLKDILKQ
jgi:NAD(P)-dependent dehydrogenase (short-subunit alcohol dehydrogenase family)